MAATQTFSNSPLICYTKLSPNCNSPRTSNIDTITIHTMAGNCSVEACADIFYPVSRQASSNYGIGSDGRIGLYCNERDRSWCTSSAANDHRAITIEVASTGVVDPWPCTDAALKSLINLCYDICKRNNIKKLMWQGNKALIGNVSQQNMTVHRWFAAKACPGDYLYNLHGYIADEVNKKLGVSTSYATCVPGYDPNPKKLPVVTPTKPTPTPVSSGSTSTPSSSSSTSSNSTSKTTPSSTSVALKGSTTEEKIWNYLTDKGLNSYAVAGIMGNLYAESGLIPNNLQNTFESKLGYTDATYTTAVDNGIYKNFSSDSAGYGLAQWTYSTRKAGLLAAAQKINASVSDLGVQLDYLWSELSTTFSKLLTSLKSATSVQAASDLFLTEFEKPAGITATMKSTRASYGQKYFDKYGSYLIQVICDELNVRKGPGLTYAVSQVLKKSNTKYTITEETKVTNSDKSIATWGKLKSGVGWINVGPSYVKKC